MAGVNNLEKSAPATLSRTNGPHDSTTEQYFAQHTHTQVRTNQKRTIRFRAARNLENKEPRFPYTYGDDNVNAYFTLRSRTRV